MHLRTELHPKPSPYQLDLASKVVTVGSCFSDVIGSQLEKYKVETLTNPFGTLFNPLSACKLLQICAGADVELTDSFVENNGRWYSYDFHSRFSAESEEALYELLDEALVKTRRFLKKADLLILTLGTANIFRQNITGEPVANCHKLPAANFTRETLLPEEIITAVAETHSLLRELNPNLKLVLTVSPVRHVKDTLELNSVSKSVLRLATHYLTDSLPDIAYFPAYELLLDDLRDYRFYKEDLLHPSPLAENYIWEKFTQAYFNEAFLTFTTEWDTVLRAVSHKPFHAESPQHQDFIQNMLGKLRALQEKVNVAQEIAFFEKQVVALPEPTETEEDEETKEIAEEIIPGYFSEELSENETATNAEETITEAPGETAPENSLTETAEHKKRRKKPRNKKKKPEIPAEEISLSEVGTTSVPASAPVEPASEPAAELAEILADPNHPVAHYGETLSDKPLQKKTLSKSAKRRESRRKKKALEDQEKARNQEMQVEKPVETSDILPEISGFKAENDTVSDEKPREFPATSPEAMLSEIPTEKAFLSTEKKPGKKKGGRKKKEHFPELFTSTPTENGTVSEEKTAENTNENGYDLVEKTTEIPSENAMVSAEKTAEISTENATENTEKTGVLSSEATPEPAAELEPKKPTKPKGSGRKPKTVKLFKSEKTSPETIAVPFLPASELEATNSIAVPFVPASQLNEPTTAPDIPEAPEKPVKKRGRPPKPKTEKSEDSTKSKTGKKTTAKTAAAKPGRKKKTEPEA